MRLSASQRACGDSVQLISSQSIRATSGLASAQMIAPARRVPTRRARRDPLRVRLHVDHAVVIHFLKHFRDFRLDRRGEKGMRGLRAPGSHVW